MNHGLNIEPPEVMPEVPARNGRIAFIEACWHKEIVDQSYEAFMEGLTKMGIEPGRIDLFEVPGSLEIPLQAKLIAKTGRYAIIVAAGMVVDGGIYRHEFVAQTVIDALMQVQLETEIPVLSVVLTPQAFHAHGEHEDFFLQHYRIKGAEAALSCAKTLENMRQLRMLGAAA